LIVIFSITFNEKISSLGNKSFHSYCQVDKQETFQPGTQKLQKHTPKTRTHVPIPVTQLFQPKTPLFHTSISGRTTPSKQNVQQILAEKGANNQSQQ